MEERSSERTFHGTYFVECFLLLWFVIPCTKVVDYVEMSLLISVKKTRHNHYSKHNCVYRYLDSLLILIFLYHKCTLYILYYIVIMSFERLTCIVVMCSIEQFLCRGKVTPI